MIIINHTQISHRMRVVLRLIGVENEREIMMLGKS